MSAAAADRGLSVSLLRPLAELLARTGADPAAFLAAVGVEATAPPEAFVDGALVDRALAELAAARGDPAFGLTLARVAVGWPLGIFGHLVWTSGTLRDALARAVRFYGSITRRATLTLEERGPIATLRQHGGARGAILAEYPFASLALRARAATDGKFGLLAVRFAHAGTATAAYRELFAAPVTFGAADHALELPVAHLDLPLATADAVIVGALEPRVAQLADSPRHGPLAETLRRAIGDRLADPPSLAQLAAALGTSARTLRRQLEAAGTSVRAIVDDLRRARADALLAAGAPLKEIAFELGFSEPSALSRAYKRWTGRAPRSA